MTQPYYNKHEFENIDINNTKTFEFDQSRW